MSTDALRRARLFLPIAEFALVSILLLPVVNATASDGPKDGETWSWNVLGWPLVPGNVGVLIWLVAAVLLPALTWVWLSTRILRHMQTPLDSTTASATP